MGAMLVRQEPTGASAVRRELASDLGLQGVDGDVIFDVSLVASELIGNAVRHGCVESDEDLDVEWTVGSDSVLISVEDHSPAMPIRTDAAVDAPSGRGIAIIETLAKTWGVERTGRGKRVWARIPFAQPA